MCCCEVGRLGFPSQGMDFVRHGRSSRCLRGSSPDKPFRFRKPSGGYRSADCGRGRDSRRQGRESSRIAGFRPERCCWADGWGWKIVEPNFARLRPSPEHSSSQVICLRMSLGRRPEDNSGLRPRTVKTRRVDGRCSASLIVPVHLRYGLCQSRHVPN